MSRFKKFFGFLLSVFLVSALGSISTAQNCQISFPTSTEADYQQRSYRSSTQSNDDNIVWSELSNGSISNNEYVAVTLEPDAFSERISFSDFRFNIPMGSVIHGITVIVEGNTSGAKPTDYVVRLKGANTNLANLNFAGSLWPLDQDGTWRYGADWYLWNQNWSVQTLNSNTFGVELQIRNLEDQTLTANIDHLKIEVDYTPPYKVCNDHACIIASVPEDLDVNTYQWNVPNDFHVISESSTENLIIIAPNPGVLGIYNLCVTPISTTGNSSQCCTHFSLQDCTPGSIGDYVFDDRNDNGIQDHDDLPMGGITVSLFDDKSNFIASTVSDDSGFYQFIDVQSGTYYIQISDFEEYRLAKADVGNDATDSDLTEILGPGTTDYFVLNPGQNKDDIDLGLRLLTRISGSAWLDNNGNGVKDPSEISFEGIEVILFDQNNQEIVSTITGQDGTYSFDDLLPALYYVVFISPDDFVFTIPGFGSTVDNLIAPGATPIIDGLASNNLSDINAGLYQAVSIGDFIWLDLNRNGLQDVSEPGIADIEVVLFPAVGTPITGTTDESGQYLFSNVPPGSYRIIIENNNDLIPTLIDQGNGTNDSKQITLVGSSFESVSFDINSGEITSDIDFGFQYKPSSISGLAWEDNDGDALNNNGENLLVSIPVALYTESGIFVDETLTDMTGAYSFTQLNPGNYYVVFEKMGSLVFTMFGMDSDVDESIVEGSTRLISLAADTDIVGIDAGFYEFATLGDYMWLDLNRNGLQDPSESGIPDLQIQLIRPIGLIVNTVTDANGIYTYDLLPPGKYIVSVLKEDGLEPSLFNQGNGQNDSDEFVDVGAFFNSMVITLSSGEVKSDLDFGFQFSPSSISGSVWIDDNADGLDNPIEDRFTGVMVSLYNNAGTVIDQTTTDASGTYIFNDVNPGDYYIVFSAPTDFVFTSFGMDSDVSSSVVFGSTDIINVTAGSGLNGIDAGLYQYGSIGDFIWYDMDRNGIQDSLDMGVPFLDVVLTDAAGMVINTQTNNQGEYFVDQLVPGSYTISLPDVPESEPTISNQGDGTNDSRVLSLIANMYNSAPVVITSGQQNINIDFGFQFKASSISGLAWEDLNFNGINDIGEPSLAGITVTLYESSLGTVGMVTTDDNGAYTFDNLNPGMYYVVFNREDPYLFTEPGLDSDVVGVITSGASSFIVLMPDDQINGVDAGYYRKLSIGDYVWEDLNLNGLQDPDESGLSGVTLELLDDTGEVIDMSMTNADGLYQFVNIDPGTYNIALGIAPNFKPTIADLGNGANDSREVNASLLSEDLDLVSGMDRVNVDFGFVMSVSSISGTSWFDVNGDGINTSNEPPATDISVSLFQQNGTLVSSTQTDMNGDYNFENLLDGDYYIVFESLINVDFTNDLTDSDVTNDIVMGSTDIINLTQDQDLTDINAGYIAYSSIGDYIWFDSNGNGLQDSNELGIPDVEISLFNESGTLVQQVISGPSGNYLFENLLTGDYYILFNVGGTFTSTQEGAGNGSDDSDVTDIFGNGSTSIFTLGFMQDRLDIDGGFEEVFATVSGNVFTDIDADGLRQLADTPLSGIMVELYSLTNGLVDTETTDIMGNYSFTQVLPDDYYVQFIIPAGLNITTADIGNDDAIDSDVTAANGTGTTDVFTLPIMGNIENIDAGVYQFATLGDQVWVDENENGLNDNLEIGAVGVTVSLLNQNGSTVDTKVTDTDGMYLFTDIVPGMYQLKFEMPDNYEFTQANIGTDSTIDSDASNTSGTLGFTNQFSLLSGDLDLDKDAGVILTGGGSITGTVWEDNNADGVRDNAEILLADITVDLYNSMDVLIATAMTDIDGNYEFTSIPPQDVYLIFNTETGQLFSSANAGMDDTIDSDATGANGTGSTELITVIIDDLTENVDAGLYKNGSIGDFVWVDADFNGIQDASENGYNGAVVELYDMNATLVASTTTTTINGMDGMYTFDDITPGIYIISIALMGDFVFTIPGAGNGTNDSDITQNGTATGSTIPVMLGSGEINNDIDAGVFEQEENNILGYAFEDVNGNGLKDFNDVNKNGIVVNLYDTADVLISSTTTADDVNGIAGFYNFLDVPDGDYYIQFVFPNGSIVTLANVGTNEALDSDLTDANGPATTDLINLSMGGATDLICGGYYLSSTLGNYVWNDMIANGIQDPSETGVNNLIVRLFDDMNNQIAMTSTFTDGNGDKGFYEFTGVAPGSYYIRVDAGTGMTFTDANQGTDDNIDSDVNGSNGFASTNLYMVNSGSFIDNIDIGLLMQPASVGDFVWEDLNGNGVQDPMEGGIEGVVAELYNDAMAFVATTTTDVTGAYLFDNIQPGLYYIVFTAPGDYITTDPDQGGNDTNDSDIMNAIEPGATNIFDLSPGENDMDIDAGFYLPADIGDFVWNDLNKDGIQDPGEPGLEGVTVDLRFGTFIVLATTVTDENGFFTFPGLKQGVYSLRFYDIPSGFQFSPKDQGTDDTKDNDAAMNGETPLISLAHGVDFMDLDAGLFDTSTLLEDDLSFQDDEENGEDEDEGEDNEDDLEEDDPQDGGEEDNDDDHQETIDALVGENTTLTGDGNLEENDQEVLAFSINIWPMPTTGLLHHKIIAKTDSPIKWTISNNIGKPVMRGTEENLETGINEFKINATDLLPGIYYIKYQMYGFYRVKPLIIVD